jgi:hypothetical protein
MGLRRELGKISNFRGIFGESWMESTQLQRDLRRELDGIYSISEGSSARAGWNLLNSRGIFSENWIKTSTSEKFSARAG